MIWSMNNVAASVIIIVPVSAGLGALRVRLLANSAELVSSFPFQGQLKSVLGLGVPIVAGFSIGVLLAMAAISAVVLGSGVVPTWAAYAPLGLAVLQIFGFTYFGIGVGAVIPNALTGPILAVGIYVMMAFGIASVDVLFDYVGATAAIYGEQIYNPPAVVFLVAIDVVLFAVGVLLVVSDLIPSRIALVLGLALLAGVVVALPSQRDVPMNVDAPESVWRCRPLGATRIEGCVPEEQEPRLDTVTQELAPLIERYAQVSDNLPQRIHLTDHYLFSNFASGDWQMWTESHNVANLAVACYSDVDPQVLWEWEDAHPQSAEDMQNDVHTLARWIASDRSVSEEMARAAVTNLSVCEAGSP